VNDESTKTKDKFFKENRSISEFSITTGPQQTNIINRKILSQKLQYTHAYNYKNMKLWGWRTSIKQHFYLNKKGKVYSGGVHIFFETYSLKFSVSH
jgi:hypothetical protein